MSEAEFVIGMPARANAAASHRARERSAQAPGFTPAELIARIEQAFGAVSPSATSATAPTGDAPRHFSPADPHVDPTQGWDMLDAGTEAPACLEQIEAARAEGYEEGAAAARRAARADAERDQALLDAIAMEMRSGGAIDRTAFATALRRTVMMLVTQIVGEAGVSAELLAARVRAATDLLADANESATLRVHPLDLPVLEGRLPGTIFPCGDEAVERGSFVMEAASTIVEDGPALWLEQLSGAIERAAVPSC